MSGETAGDTATGLVMRRGGGRLVRRVRAFCARRRSDGAESGFTLIELIIVLVIMPFIVGAVTIAIMTTLKNESATSNRLANSTDAQITSANFTQDVQNAMFVTTAGGTSPAQCTSGGPPAGTVLLGLEGADAVVTYSDVAVTEPGGKVQNELVRRTCKGGSPISEEAVAFNLPPGQSAATVTCGLTVASCSSYQTTWLATAGVSAVSLTIIEPLSQYDFTLSSTPRNWNNTSCGAGCGGGNPLPPLALTGTGVAANGCVLTLQSSGDSTTINGQLVLNSSGYKVCNGNNGVTLNVNPGPIDSYQCGASCGAVLSSYHGTCTENGGSCSVQNLTTQYTVPVLPAPATPTTADPPQTCAIANNVTCNPGYYPNGLTIPSNDNVSFASGNYLFGNTLNVLGNLTLGSGDYTFNVPGGNAVLFNHDGATLQGNGVFLYVKAGAFSVSPQNCTVTLTAPATGPYAGVAYYQPPSNTSPLSLGASGSSTFAAGGSAIIAPGAAVTLGSSGDMLTADNLVAASLLLGSTGVTVTLG